MSAAKKLAEQQYTFQEHLELEQYTEYKSKFLDGMIVAMAGGTPNASSIQCLVVIKN